MLMLVAVQIPHQVEISKFSLTDDNDSIGSIICKRAEQINAVAVVLAKHNKGRIAEFFVGSVTNYCESNLNKAQRGRYRMSL